MPRRRRLSKNRITDEIGLRAWSRAFFSGFDFLGELRPLGIETQEELRAAAPGAWARWGRAWLDSRAYRVWRRSWALDTFGEPEQCH